jgi:iron complex transport system permease protein
MNEIQKRITFTIFSILICFCFVSLLYGKFFIDIDIILNLFFSKLGITNNSIYSNEQDLIIFEVRLPRIVLTALVGGSLSISGAVLQSVFKNPLVSPFILGVSSGASFGVSIIIFFFSTYNVFILQLFAFTFGFLAVFFVILSSHLFSSRNSVILVLSGIIVSSFFTSLVSLVQYFSEEQKLQSILFWTFGSFSNSSWENILVIFPICSLCFLFLIAQSWRG